MKPQEYKNGNEQSVRTLQLSWTGAKMLRCKIRDDALLPTTATAQVASAASPLTVDLQLSLGHVGVSLKNDPELQAVTIEHVHPNDLAARAGLRPGDVILSINDEPVRSHEDAVTRIQQTGSGILSLQYLQGSTAEEARDLERKRAAERRVPRRWLTVPNALIALFALLWLYQLHVSRAPANDLSAQQFEMLQQLAMHQAKDELVFELGRIATRAQHFLSHNHSGEALEKHEPKLLMRMLRLTMQLDHFLNVTDYLGLDAAEAKLNQTELDRKVHEKGW